jgi:serine protease Do
MSARIRDVVKLSAIIAVVFGLGLTVSQAFNIPRPGLAQARSDSRTAVAPAALNRGSSRDLPSFADVVDRVNPSIVYIQVNTRSRAQQGHENIPPEMQDFFRRYQQQQPQQAPRIRQGSGTGFVVTRDGYILTNNHVVQDAERVTVHLLDNREFTARIVGRDPNTDIAVIKIDADNLPAVAFGNSDQARIGDWVLAFGNPLGFTFTVTSGIVSAKGRRLEGLQDPGARYSIQDFIQTDAAINPGNSGGPLVNMNGDVIGVNSAIASSTRLYAGYGFAIPINLARRVMDDLITKGRVDRAVLGIGISDARAEDAEYVGLREIKGVNVGSYTNANSPAKAAGILEGDVIVAVNDTAVDHVAQLQQMVGFRRAGERVRVTVMRRENGRAGVRRTFDVRLVAADQDSTQLAANPGPGGAAPSPMEGRLGLRIEALPASYVERARLTDAQQGVLVADVEEGGPAWQRVFPPEEGGPDVILQVNDTRVRTPEDFKQALRAAPAGSVIQLRILKLNIARFPTQVVNIRSR